MQIAFIGGGNMGEAMLKAILNNKIASAGDILVGDIQKSRLEYLKQKYSVGVMSSNLEAASRGEVVILAIKPQNLSEVMAELRGKFKPSQLVLSIIAGARVNTLREGLGHKVIIRVMPNTPAQIGQGISVWTATSEVSEEQKRRAQVILGAMGKEVFVTDEGYIDMATAISGSGPAYVFLFVESLVSAATEIGLPPDMAYKLVLETILGSGHFAKASGKELAELRRMVTSPGGTTAEALSCLEKGGFTGLIMEAVSAAYHKARSLGE